MKCAVTYSKRHRQLLARMLQKCITTRSTEHCKTCMLEGGGCWHLTRVSSCQIERASAVLLHFCRHNIPIESQPQKASSLTDFTYSILYAKEVKDIAATCYLHLMIVIVLGKPGYCQRLDFKPDFSLLCTLPPTIGC